MVALATSAAIAVYLLIPFALFRVILSRFVPLRAFQESKTEEFTNAGITLIVIFLCSVFVVHHAPYLNVHPFPCPKDAEMRIADYQQVIGAIWSDKYFRNDASFWDALWRSARRQGRFLSWYYLLVAASSLIAVLLMHYYASLRQNHKAFAWLVKSAILPHVSQWYALLTPFLSPDKGTLVVADILTTGKILYKGQVIEYFLDKDGDLSGLILGNPRRFDRDAHIRERERWGTARGNDFFWRKIPSAKLYLFATEILNLNLSYESPKASEDDLVRQLTDRVSGKKGFTVTVNFNPRR